MEDILEWLIEEANNKGCSFAEARYVKKRSSSIRAQDGRIEELTQRESAGVAIRVIKDGCWGFASSASLEKGRLAEALYDAIASASFLKGSTEEKAEVKEIPPTVGRKELKCKISPEDVVVEDKAQRVLEWEREARGVDSERINNTVVSLSDVVREEMVFNSFGTRVGSKLVHTLASVFVSASEGEIRQSAYERKGGAKGYELVEEIEPEEFSLKAANKAIQLLSASPPPAGVFPAILDPEVVGLFVHEALGHNSEADAVWSGQSIIKDKKGQAIAAPCVTIIDDATIEEAFGFYFYDSEGTPARKNVIIKDGILMDYLYNLETAAKLEANPTGNARAEGYEVPPIVRMSNTFMAPGDWTFEEMLKEIKEGVYLKGGRWGYVYPERGQFTFNVEEAWLIKDGELKEHLRDVSMSGMTLETLKKIKGVSRDFKLASPGYCGKNGQTAFVDNGGPYILVEEITVGGRR
ncbi:TldD/PmbA family protein [bacterium]|nr:TldD/PmbA family protein [bacterium]